MMPVLFFAPDAPKLRELPRGIQLEVLALVHQLQVLRRSPRRSRPRLTPADRLLWMWIRGSGRSDARTRDRQAETVIAWHHCGIRAFGGGRVGDASVGRPLPADVRVLIRAMSNANPLWGAPRIHGELLKLGIDVSQATVAKCMVRSRHPPSQTWRTFWLPGQIVAADFCVGTDCDVRLVVLVFLAHERIASSTWPSLTIQPRPGRFSSCAKRSPGTRRLDFWSTTAITRSTDGRTRRRRSESTKSSRHRVRRGSNTYTERFIGFARREYLDLVIGAVRRDYSG